MIKKILKYLGKTLTYTLLTLLIIFGLSLLFVFVTSKVAKSRNQEPPINLFTIISPSMTPSINVYDVVVSIKTKPSKIKTGDVISFYSSNPNVNGMTVTHRVVQVNQNGDIFSFKTKGDSNKTIDPEVIYQDKVVGKIFFKIPQLGRIQFFLGSKGGWLIAILIPALAIISYDIYKIIKLIIVKQKIMAYQSQSEVPETEMNTTQDAALEEIKQGLEENKVDIETNDITPIAIPENIELVAMTVPIENEVQDSLAKEVVEEVKTEELLEENKVDSEPEILTIESNQPEQEEIIVIE